MGTTILITGFGPFPGAPFNPTESLVLELGRRRHPAFTNVRRVVHVFQVSYEAVDRELPVLLAHERPGALVMFGLAGRARHLRIETRARNAVTRLVPDAAGQSPAIATIAFGGPPTLPLRAPTSRLVAAAHATGVAAGASHDAGRYLCNYLCWRAAEAARAGGPRLTAFVHVPNVLRTPIPHRRRASLSLHDLTQAGEAIVRAALAAMP